MDKRRGGHVTSTLAVRNDIDTYADPLEKLIDYGIAINERIVHH